MNGFINNAGYVMIQNDKGKLPRQIQLHRYLMQKHYGIKIPKEFVVHHKDENKLNNSIDNLIVLTHAGHIRWHHNGEKSKRAKLSTEDILDIYEARKTGIKVKVLCDKYEISSATVNEITHGTTWKHLHLDGLYFAKPTNQGEENNRSKLTESKVLEIRQALATGEMCRTIGERYGVSREVISNIKHNRLWAHIQLTDLSQVTTRNYGGTKGSANPAAKLNEEKVKEIKRLLRTTKLNTVDLGIQFGVSNMLIGRIKNGKAWKHVTED